MEDQTVFKVPETRSAVLAFKVIEWRDKNGHLLARIVVGKDKVVFTVKCPRCKHVEEKDVGSIK